MAASESTHDRHRDPHARSKTMTAPLVFMDTETTGLSLDDDIWEFAAIRREIDGTETKWHMFVEHDRKKCGQLPLSFRDDHYSRYLDHKAVSQREMCRTILDIFRNGKPHVVGAVPNFDTERITRLFEALDYGSRPDWHYHLIDIENLAVGFLTGKYGLRVDLPWDSDELTTKLGLESVADGERHTAMGDARWAMRIYDRVMGGA